MALIRVSELRCSYRVGTTLTTVVKDVSFDVEPGEFIAIRGPSGSGKSTLLYAMGGLLKPDSGEITFEGKPFSRLNETELAYDRGTRIGFVFQQFHLLPKATILENLLLSKIYPLERQRSGTREEWQEQARQIARKLGIDSELEKLPNQLSGGQQQRVAIARALMNEPSVILADEPTGNLDSENAAQILKIFRELNQAGRTVILVTHDEQIADQADRIIQIKDGHVERDSGTSQSARSNPPGGPRLGNPGLKTRFTPIRLARAVFPIVLANILRNKLKSALTMMGVSIGVSSVLIVMTLGVYAEQKLRESFRSLGSQRVSIYRKSEDFYFMPAAHLQFPGFRVPEDLDLIRKFFPAVEAISPVEQLYNVTPHKAWSSGSEQASALGVGEDYLYIQNLNIREGRPFSAIHVSDRASVCILGSDMAAGMPHPLIGSVFEFSFSSPFSGRTQRVQCTVRAVLERVASPSPWDNPNKMIFLPFTYYKDVERLGDLKRTQYAVAKVSPGAGAHDVAQELTPFLTSRFGSGSELIAESESMIAEQMQKILAIFGLLLGAVALMSLGVGGAGIHNLMMASIAERMKEFGLRKALGATPSSLKAQLLLESLTLCGLAGCVGWVFGVVGYQSLLLVATALLKQGEYQWLFVPTAFLLSLVSVIAVGVVSGLSPARRVEKMEVIEALRSE